MDGQFPLQLKGYFFIDQTVIANSDFLPENPSEVSQSISARVHKTENKDDEFFCMLSVKSNLAESKNYPYRFDISIFGTFIVQAGIPAQSAVQMVKEIGAALLVGAIRERLSVLMAGGPWIGSLLPIVPLTEIEFADNSD
jgi:preprotein translocase subunit SecB